MPKHTSIQRINGYSMGAVIKKYREISRLNQSELADSLAINKNTVYNWENDKSKPDVDTIRVLCDRLHIPIQELFNIHDVPYRLTDKEQIMMNHFRSMSARSQSMAYEMIVSMAVEEHRLEQQELKDSYFVIGLEQSVAAAGQGNEFSQWTVPQKCFARVSPKSAQADRMIRVSGHSMEPVYYDGDILFVVDTEEAFPGDDVISSTADGLVVKRIGTDGKLFSVNPKYPFGPKTEADRIKVIGKVVGVATKDDIASGELIDVLNELLEDEVAEFYEKYGDE